MNLANMQDVWEWLNQLHYFHRCSGEGFRIEVFRKYVTMTADLFYTMLKKLDSNPLFKQKFCASFIYQCLENLTIFIMLFFTLLAM